MAYTLLGSGLLAGGQHLLGKWNLVFRCSMGCEEVTWFSLATS